MPDKPEMVYILYDFRISGLLPANLSWIKEHPPNGFTVEYPHPTEGMAQGEIWRNIVKPQLDMAGRVIAFVDLPNANVGFEVGYALGQRKQVALASYKSIYPVWLQQSPFKGYECHPLTHVTPLESQILSDHWFQRLEHLQPEPGREILLLCPQPAGEVYIREMQKYYPSWRVLSDNSKPLLELPAQLNGIGAIVWVILPHDEGDTARDGTENAVLAVIAGYAEGCGLPVWVLEGHDCRNVVDVLPKAEHFDDLKEFEERLRLIAREFENQLHKQVEGEPSDEAPPPRPPIDPLPILDFENTLRRFIGRERLRSDYEDALRGLDARWKGQTVGGGAKVQAIWYHGFGGMGKSWFLRRAIVETQDTLSAARVALIDWPVDTWNTTPIARPPETSEELFASIAHRLAQLYGVAALDSYWRVDQRIHAVDHEYRRVHQQFNEDLDELARRYVPTDALRTAFIQTQISWEDSVQRKELYEQLRYYDTVLRERVFRRWFTVAKHDVSDPDAVRSPDELRLAALQVCIRTAAHQHPLVLVFDTCEVLSVELDRWLRRLLAPLCDGKTPLLVLVASRLTPDNAESPGSREGWRVEVGDERWRSVAFDEGVSFTVNEVTRALQNLHRPVTAIDALAEELQRRTLGVPFALGTLLDMHERGDEILSQLETLGPQVDRASQRAEEEVVEQVTARFLVHLRNRPDRHQDFADVVALSLLREANRDLLGRLWGPRNVRERLRALATRYGLVASGDLHVTVRAFLRRRWRMEDRPELVDQMIQRLTEVVEASDRPTTPEASGYFEALADHLNIQGWCRGEEALKDFAPALVLALAYDTHVHLFITLAAEIPLHRRQKATSQLLDKLSKRPAREDMPWGSDELLAWWQNEARQAHWLHIEQAALDMLIGLKDARDQRYTDALTRLQAALKYVDASSLPRPLLVGSALFVIGSALRNAVDTAESASEAYRLAIRIGYLEAEAWNNLAVLAQFRRKLEDTEEFLRKAWTLDPTEPLYPCNLGHIYRIQKDYAAAEKWYRQALTLDPTEPLYPCNLGHIYRIQKDYVAAEKWYRQALAVDEKYAPAYDGLGHISRAQKDYVAAEKWYRQALAVDEKHAPAYDGLGHISRAQKDYVAAEKWYRQALVIAPTEHQYLLTLGHLCLARKDYAAAEEWYQKALVMNEKYAPAYGSLGLFYWAPKRSKAYEEQFRQALAIAPTESLYPLPMGQQKRYEADEERYYNAFDVHAQHAAAYNSLGKLDQIRKRYEVAEEWYRKALELDPTEPLYPRNLGDLYEKQKRYEAAAEWYRKALEVDEKCAPAYNDLGLLAQAQRQWETAVTQFQRAIELEPTEPLYPRNLGDLYRERREYGPAAEWYQRALAVDAHYPWAYNDLGLLAKTQGHWEEAITQFQRAIELEPTEPLYPRNVGDLYRERREYARAAEWYHKALAVDEKYAPAYNDLGLLAKAQGQWEEAVTQFQRAIELEPTEPLYPRNVGDLYRERREYARAAEWYHKALAVDARYAPAHNSLGLLAKAQGQWETAEAQFQQAIELEPTEPIYPDNLGDLYRERREYAQAEEWYHKASAVDAQDPWAYNGLGLLAQVQGQWDTAVTQFKKALELLLTEVLHLHNPEDIYEELQRFEGTEAWYCSDADVLCDIAWLLYLTSTDLIKAEHFATRAVEIGPGDNHTLHLLGCLRLAAIQLRCHGWDYASSRILEWLRRSDREFIRESRDDVLELFRVMLSLGKASELATMLYQLDNGTHWLPWAEAIASLAENDSAQLLSEEARAIRDEIA